MKDSILLEKTAEELSTQKARLVELMLARKTAQQRIEPLKRDATATKAQLPASWAQQRLWFFDQLEGGTSAYNVPLVLRLRGSLDEDALLRALHEIVQRHEVLRTTFVNANGEPRQEIAATADPAAPKARAARCKKQRSKSPLMEAGGRCPASFRFDPLSFTANYSRSEYFNGIAANGEL